jgi:hypothetical protein
LGVGVRVGVRGRGRGRGRGRVEVVGLLWVVGPMRRCEKALE